MKDMTEKKDALIKAMRAYITAMTDLEHQCVDAKNALNATFKKDLLEIIGDENSEAAH